MIANEKTFLTEMTQKLNTVEENIRLKIKKGF